MSVRCTWPQGCARATLDPSGRCQDHRVVGGSQMVGAARVGSVPPPADPSINSAPVIWVNEPYNPFSYGTRYEVAPEQGAACIEYQDGEHHWVVNRQLHREDGPAVECEGGDQRWYIHGKLHREDGPAAERSDGSKRWYQRGKLHREDGPAVAYTSGQQEWYHEGQLHRDDGPVIESSHHTEWKIHGQYHREDGPAVVRSDGTRMWYINGQLHREDGPAVVLAYGEQRWLINGKLHREDGPAIERRYGKKEWHVNGERVLAALCQKLQRKNLSLLWHDWDEGLREELVAAGVTPERANEAYAAGLTGEEGLRRVLIDGAPLEWVLAWMGSQ